MTIHICKICSKTFNRLSSLKKHTEKKKKPCSKYDKKILSNPLIWEEGPPKREENPEKKDAINTQKNKNIFSIDDEPSLKTSFLCEYCNKTFTRNDNLKKHLLNYCKVKKELNNNQNELQNLKIEKMTEHIETLQKQIGDLLSIIKTNPSETHTNSHNTNNTNNANNTNNSNNTNNGNITNNTIQIEKIEFGKEDLTKLTDNFFINTLMNCYGAEIPNKIIENIHFNPRLVENMNVFIADLSRNKAMVYDGKTWNVTTATEVVDNLLDKAVIYCENKHDELREKIENNERQKKKINKEMDIMKIMTNFEPTDFNDDGEGIDVDGAARPLKDFKRGKKLNERAKKLITMTLQNKKNIVLENYKATK